jgi:sugar lactone lactonase YvrE
MLIQATKTRIGLLLLVCLALLATTAPGATSGAPFITTMDRVADRVEGGAEVVATGVNFTADTSIVIGDAVVDDLVVESATQIRFRVPRQQAPGARTLSLRTAGGIYQSRFTIHPKPLAELAPGEITTVGGGLYDVGDGSDRTRSNVVLSPTRVALDAARNVYIADALNHRIRRVDAATGTIYTVVGSGRRGFDGDGRPAETAALDSPASVAVDRAGNLFVADTVNDRVRRVDAVTGAISTVAQFEAPVDLALDAADNLFVSEAGASRVQRVDAATGAVTTVAGGGDCPASGEIGDGGLATEACVYPDGICLDAAGNLFIADAYNQRIRRVDAATGVITTVAGAGRNGNPNPVEGPATEIYLDTPIDVAVASDGTLYLVDGHEGGGDVASSGALRRVDPETGWMSLRHVESDINFATGLALDDAGNLYVADPDDGLVRVDSASSGLLADFAGSGLTGPRTANSGQAATSAPLGRLVDLVDAGDSLYGLTDSFLSSHQVFRIDLASGLLEFLTLSADPYDLGSSHALAVDAHGNVFTSNGDFFTPTLVHRFSASAAKKKLLAGGGQRAPIPGRKGTKVGLPAPPAWLEYGSGTLYVSSATGLLELDPRTGRIRAVTQAYGRLAYSPEGLYVGAGHVVQLLEGRRAGIVAGGNGAVDSGDGGPATLAGLDSVYDIAVDRIGNLYIVTNGRVRRVDAATGIIETVAGGGASGYTGDGGPTSAAALDRPLRVAAGDDGVVFITCASGVIRAFRTGG